MRLGEREVHVWYVRPEEVDPPLLRACEDLMAPEERERQGRFAFAKDRRQHAIARALVRTTLSRYAAVDPREWRFRATPLGRPEIAGDASLPPLRFNVSHTPGLVACGVVLGREIGIDVEGTGRRPATLAAAARYFSRSEVATLEALPPHERRERHLDYWTLKEAYVKARGAGLSIPLREFSMHLDEGHPIRISFGAALSDEPGAWQFARLQPTPSHRLAIALRRGAGPDYRLVVNAGMPLPEYRRGSVPGPGRDPSGHWTAAGPKA